MAIRQHRHRQLSVLKALGDFRPSRRDHGEMADTTTDESPTSPLWARTFAILTRFARPTPRPPTPFKGPQPQTSLANVPGGRCAQPGRTSRNHRVKLTTLLLSYPAKSRSQKTGKTSFTRFLITLEGVFCIGGTGTKIDSNSTGYGRINTRNLCVAFDWLCSPSARAELRRQSNNNVLINFGCVFKTVQRIISNC